jgi:hypothetical protein
MPATSNILSDILKGGPSRRYRLNRPQSISMMAPFTEAQFLHATAEAVAKRTTSDDIKQEKDPSLTVLTNTFAEEPAMAGLRAGCQKRLRI